MGKLDELLRSVSRHGPGAHRSAGRRALALALCATLALGGISPGAAFAADADSEGEGGTPPGTVPEVEKRPNSNPAAKKRRWKNCPNSPPKKKPAAPKTKAKARRSKSNPKWKRNCHRSAKK